MIGIDLDKNPFREPIRSRIEAASQVLRLPGRVLLNEQSHPDFGWQLRDQFKDWELGNHAVTIVGGFPMLRGFAADSTVICDDRNFVSLCGFPRDRVSFGFLKVQAGSVDATVQALKAVLPSDVEVFSRAAILSREIDHWVNQTSTGQLFAFGVLVAMIVATVVVYQVLSNDVREHLPEYATLKAMGYSPGPAVPGGRGAVAHLHDDRLRSCRAPGDRGLLGNPGAGRDPHAADPGQPADHGCCWPLPWVSCRASCPSPGCGRPSPRTCSEAMWNHGRLRLPRTRLA